MKNTGIKTINAEALRAGRVHGLKFKGNGQLHDDYCVGAPSNNKCSFVSFDEGEICRRLDLRRVGSLTIPEGLLAAVKFALGFSSNGLSFTFDGLGNWGLRFEDSANGDVLAYENGSEWDAAGGWFTVKGNETDKIKALKTIFTYFRTVEIYVQKALGNDRNIVFKVADVDDGRGLFCAFTFAFDGLEANGDYDERMAGFIGSFDEIASVVPDPVEAVASYPAAQVAAMRAPKAGDGEETALEGRNAIGGADVRQEPETATESKETA